MKVIIHLSFFIIFQSCTGQNFEYQDYVKEVNFSMPITVQQENIIKIEDYLPKNYVKNASIDYTKIIQNALNENRKILFPNFPLLINVNGLEIPSNTEVYFSSSSKLIQQALKKERTDVENIREWYDIIRIYNKENIKIYNAVIEGNRINNKGKKGEWGAGIGIRNSKNIIIKNCIISNTWGDGIFIGSEDGGLSTNIHVENVIVDFSRRTGIAITSGNNVYLQNVFISNVSGTAPEIGLDIEPSWNKDEIDNVYINNVKTFNCGNYGFAISLDQLSIGNNKRKNVNIFVDGYTDKMSIYSFGYFINPSNSLLDPIGKISLKNMTFENPIKGSIKNSINNKSITVNSTNIKVKFNDSMFEPITIK